MRAFTGRVSVYLVIVFHVLLCLHVVLSGRGRKSYRTGSEYLTDDDMHADMKTESNRRQNRKYDPVQTPGDLEEYSPQEIINLSTNEEVSFISCQVKEQSLLPSTIKPHYKTTSKLRPHY